MVYIIRHEKNSVGQTLADTIISSAMTTIFIDGLVALFDAHTSDSRSLPSTNHLAWSSCHGHSSAHLRRDALVYAITSLLDVVIKATLAHPDFVSCGPAESDRQPFI